MSQVIFASMPAMGTQAAMARTLSKVGLFVPSEISAAAYDNDAHAIDNLLACGIRYEIWRVDAALANTNLDNRQKIAFKSASTKSDCCRAARKSRVCAGISAFLFRRRV